MNIKIVVEIFLEYELFIKLFVCRVIFFLFYSFNIILLEYFSYCIGVYVLCLDNLWSNIKLNFSI